MTNDAMPGMVKIGRTARDPGRRAAELRTTGVPGRFRVAFQARALDAARSEGLAHHALRRHRVAGDREFFRVNTGEAARIVSMACQVPKPASGKALVALLVLAALAVAFVTGRLG